MNTDFDTKDSVFGIMTKRDAPNFYKDNNYHFLNVKCDLRYYIHPNIHVRFRKKANTKTFRKWVMEKLRKSIIYLEDYEELDKLMGKKDVILTLFCYPEAKELLYY